MSPSNGRPWPQAFLAQTVKNPVLWYLRTRSNQLKKKFVENDVKSKYPEEYSTADKVDIEKKNSEEILFRVELIAS